MTELSVTMDVAMESGDQAAARIHSAMAARKYPRWVEWMEYACRRYVTAPLEMTFNMFTPKWEHGDD